MVLLEGQSMGGGICTRLAEREPALFDGVLAIGAALMTRKDQQSPSDLETVLLNRPLIPIIFLTNESELGPIEQYMKKADMEKQQAEKQQAEAAVNAEKSLSTGEIIPPALWTVSRPGHNWTNQQERYSSIKALVTWLTFGTFITCRRIDNTRPGCPPPSDAVFEGIDRMESDGVVGQSCQVNPHGGGSQSEAWYPRWALEGPSQQISTKMTCGGWDRRQMGRCSWSVL